MTSTNDGKDVKSNQTSGQKGKKYYLELYNSLKERLGGSESQAERVQHLCEAWRRIHSICRHAATDSHPILLEWLERHTAHATLQSLSEAERAALDATLLSVAQEVDSHVSERDGKLPWEGVLQQRAVWYRGVLGNPWGHPVLKVLLDSEATPPDEETIIEWLKGEREILFVRRVHELVASKKTRDHAISLVGAVMDRRRAGKLPISDLELAEEQRGCPTPQQSAPTFEDILGSRAGFTDETWCFLTDVEFALLHKADRMTRFIELAKLTPLKNGYDRIESLQNRLRKAKTAREKKMWKDVNDVAILIAQMMVARCMVVPACAGGVRAALYRCARALCGLLPAARARRDLVALAVPAVTAAHLYVLAKAVHKQRCSEDMRPFVCELYVRAITSGMNELEKLKLKADKEQEARQTEKTLASWFLDLGCVFGSVRLLGECTLTAFSVHPSREMYDRIRATPDLPPVRLADQLQEPKLETNAEYGSWASDSRSQTNFVKTSEHLNMKQTQQANVLSTAILSEGEALGLGVELCQDIAVLLSGPRVKTLSWDLDRELLLSNCVAHMERTAGGTRALTTELRFLHLDPRDYQHLKEEEDDDENDVYYGIEKGYEHLVELPEPQPEAVWEDTLIFDDSHTESAYSTETEDIAPKSRKKKTKKLSYSSCEDEDPLSTIAEAKKTEKKKERPHSKERSKEDTEPSKERKKKPKKERSRSKDKESKKERKRKIKAEKASTGPLSQLIGVKVERPNDPLDSDCEGKSSLASLFCETNYTNVEYDGQFSMDELKSPDRKSPPKARKDSVGSAVNKNRTDKTTTTINPEVKNQIAKLLQFRRNKSTTSTESSNSPAQSPVPFPHHPKGEPQIKTEQMSNWVGSKIVNPSELPKGILNSRQSLELSSLNEEISNLMKNTKPQSKSAESRNNFVNKTINKVSYESTDLSTACSRTVPVKSVSRNRMCSIPELQLRYLESLPQGTEETQERKPQQPSQSVSPGYSRTPQVKQYPTHGNKPQGYKSAPNEHKNEAPRQSAIQRSPVKQSLSHQSSFEDFLKGRQESKDTVFSTTTTERRISRVMKPATRVSPILPNILKSSKATAVATEAPKAEPMTSQSAKPVVQQKKPENAPNTFLRLSYMHKSKQNDAKPKPDAEQDQTALQKSVSDELDKRIAEIRQFKMNAANPQRCVAISKVTNTLATCTRPKESPPKVEIIKQRPPENSVLNDYPVLKDMFQIKEVQPSYRRIDTKADSPKQPSVQKSALSEKDQQDLINMLKQQNKLNEPIRQSKAHSYSTLTNLLNSNPAITIFNNNIQVQAPNQQPKSTSPILNQQVKIPKQTKNLPQTDKKDFKAQLISNATILKTAELINNRIMNSRTKPASTVVQSTSKLNDAFVESAENVMKTKDIQIEANLPTKHATTPFSNARNEIVNTIRNPAKVSNVDKKYSSVKQNWTTVMDAIRKQKTPSRGQDALEMVLNSDAYEKYNSTQNLRNLRIVKQKSEQTNQSTVVKQDTMRQIQSTPAVQTKVNTQPLKPTETAQPKIHINVEMTNNQPVIKIQEVPEVINPISQTLNSKTPRENDPFISGTQNSEYDLIGELMDDDIRQELGELSSDEERSYAAPAVTDKIKNVMKTGRSGLKKSVSTVTTERKLNINAAPKLKDVCKTSNPVTEKIVLNSNKSVDVKPTVSNDSKTKLQILSNEKVSLISRNIIQNFSKNVTSQISQEKTTSKDTSQIKSAKMDTPNLIITAPPPPSSNVVVIRPDMPYEPYPTLHITEAPVNTNIQNSFVAVNNVPTMNTIQLTTFTPVMAPVLLQNSIGLSTVLPTATTPIVAVPNVPQTGPANIPLSKPCDQQTIISTSNIHNTSLKTAPQTMISGPDNVPMSKQSSEKTVIPAGNTPNAVVKTASLLKAASLPLHKTSYESTDVKEMTSSIRPTSSVELNDQLRFSVQEKSILKPNAKKSKSKRTKIIITNNEPLRSIPVVKQDDAKNCPGPHLKPNLATPVDTPSRPEGNLKFNITVGKPIKLIRKVKIGAQITSNTATEMNKPATKSLTSDLNHEKQEKHIKLDETISIVETENVTSNMDNLAKPVVPNLTPCFKVNDKQETYTKNDEIKSKVEAPLLRNDPLLTTQSQPAPNLEHKSNVVLPTQAGQIHLPKIHQTPEFKNNVDTNKSCERKVLSEVQEKLTTPCPEKVEGKITRNQRLSTENDRAIENLKEKDKFNDKERLKKKRLDIINRETSYRCLEFVIVLPYAPIKDETQNAVFEKQPDSSDQNIVTDVPATKLETNTSSPASTSQLSEFITLNTSTPESPGNIENIVKNLSYKDNGCAMSGKTKKSQAKKFKKKKEKMTETVSSETTEIDIDKLGQDDKGKIANSIDDTPIRVSNRIRERKINKSVSVTCETDSEIEVKEMSQSVDLLPAPITSEAETQTHREISSLKRLLAKEGDKVVTKVPCEASSKINVKSAESDLKLLTTKLTDVSTQLQNGTIQILSSPENTPDELPYPDVKKGADASKELLDVKETPDETAKDSDEKTPRNVAITPVQTPGISTDPKIAILCDLKLDNEREKNKSDLEILSNINADAKNQKVTTEKELINVICHEHGETVVDTISIPAVPIVEQIITENNSKSEHNENILNTEVIPIDSDSDVNEDANTNTEFSENIDNVNISDIPQSYKNGITFEELPIRDPNNPKMRSVRVKLPNGRMFKATVHGTMNFDFDWLLQDRTLRKVLHSDIKEKKRVLLNVQQLCTTSNEIIQARIKSIRSEEFKSASDPDVVNLISDDEDDSEAISKESKLKFTTEFGSYAVKSLKKHFSKHQNKLLQKCTVKLTNCDPKGQLAMKTKSSENEILSNLRNAIMNSVMEENNQIMSLEGDTNTSETVLNTTATEIIELDDSSDEDTIPKIHSGEKIDDLKNLLLKDLGVADIFTESTESNNDIENNHISSSLSNKSKLKKKFKAYVEPTKKDYSNIIPYECFVKLQRCDDLVRKMEDKIRISDISSEVIDVDEDFEPKLPRSGSFSILNDLASLDDVAAELTEADIDRSSPIIDIVETITAFHESEADSYTEHAVGKMLDYDSYETTLCYSDWFDTKKKIRSSLVCNLISESEDNVDPVIDSKTDVSTDYDSDTDITLCSSNISDPQNKSVNEIGVVPSLKKIMAEYYAHDFAIDLPKSMTVSKNVPIITCKRKLVNEYNEIANKVSKIEDNISEELERDIESNKSSEQVESNTMLIQDPNIEETLIRTLAVSEVNLEENDKDLKDERMVNQINDINLKNIVCKYIVNNVVSVILYTKYPGQIEQNYKLTGSQDDVPQDDENITEVDLKCDVVNQNMENIIIKMDESLLVEVHDSKAVNPENDKVNSSIAELDEVKSDKEVFENVNMTKDISKEILELQNITNFNFINVAEEPSRETTGSLHLTTNELNEPLDSISDTWNEPISLKVEDKSLVLTSSAVPLEPTSETMNETTSLKGNSKQNDNSMEITSPDVLSDLKFETMDSAESLNLAGISVETNSPGVPLEPKSEIMKETTEDFLTKIISPGLPNERPHENINVSDSQNSDQITEQNCDKVLPADLNKETTISSETESTTESSENVEHNEITFLVIPREVAQETIHVTCSENSDHSSEHSCEIPVNTKDIIDLNLTDQDHGADKENEKMIVTENLYESVEKLEDKPTKVISDNRLEAQQTGTEIITEQSQNDEQIRKDDTQKFQQKSGGIPQNYLEITESPEEVYSENKESLITALNEHTISNVCVDGNDNLTSLEMGDSKNNDERNLEDNSCQCLEESTINTDSGANNREKNLNNIDSDVTCSSDDAQNKIAYTEHDNDTTVTASSASLNQVNEQVSSEIDNADTVSDEVAIIVEGKPLTVNEGKYYCDTEIVEIESVESPLRNSIVGSPAYEEGSIDEIQEHIEHDKVTMVYREDNGVLLKGVEYEDPERGTYYVFGLEKSSVSSANISNAPIESVDQETQIEGCDGEILSAEIKQENNTIDFNDNMEVMVPTKTYTKRNFKRKLVMGDISLSVKKRRLSKIKRNIDSRKLSNAEVSSSVYIKEFTRLLEYCSTIEFSYSISFHKDQVDVENILNDWPIRGDIMNESQAHEESYEFDKLFEDLDEKPPYDPLTQSLSEELDTEYVDTVLEEPCKTNDSNFNMGFGEGSGRVIQNFESGGVTKFSAATLSDVKHSQPFLLSEDYYDCENEKSYILKEKDQIEKIKRSIAHIQLRDKVRSFFEKTALELNHDIVKEKGKTSDSETYPFDLYIPKFFEPAPVNVVVQVVQVGQLPVSAAAQNPVTCDPRVTQVSDASPSQCSEENSPRDDSQQGIKTEYTELTTADLSMPMETYQHHIQTMPVETQEAKNISMTGENIPIETELIKSEVKIELVEETSEDTKIDEKMDDTCELTNSNHLNNIDYTYHANSTNVSMDQDANIQMMQPMSDVYTQQKYQNGAPEKTDQIAHAMSAAGISTTTEPVQNTRAQALVNIISQKIRHSNGNAAQNSINTYSKSSPITAMALQQALAQILPPPLNQTNAAEGNQQGQNPTVTPQVLHIVQGKNASGNQITLVDNTQQSVINQNATPVLHIVQNKAPNSSPNSSGNPSQQQNTFSGLSLVDTGLQQGGNQLLHIVNTGNQKNANAGQLLKRVNLLTNLTNVPGSNDQKMVQFVCKSADGKSIQLNAPHQRSMVLRLQPIETPNIQTSQSKPMENQDMTPSPNTPNSSQNKETAASQQEIKSRSVYEENYAKFIQSSSVGKPVGGSTSLPKFNQAFGKSSFQDGNQKQPEISGNNAHLPPVNTSNENAECPPSENNSINLEHISQMSSPPLLLRKSPQTSQSQPNLVQQIKQTIAPMNIQTMHGGVIYTRQIPVNIGGGQTINLITVPSTELIDDKQQSEVKFVNQSGEIEPSIIKIVPQSQPAPNAEVTQDESNNQVNMSNDNAQNPQPQPVLTQMRIKLPMLSKTPQMVSGARVVRPSFFQIQRNVIGGANQQVYQQLVLTAAPPLGQQTIRLPQAQAVRPKAPSETQSSPESQMSSSTLEQLREFDMVLEQVKERSTVQPNSSGFKLNATSSDTTDSNVSGSSTPVETAQPVLYSIGGSQQLNVAYVNRKAAVATPSTSTFVRSPDSTGVADSPSSSNQAQSSQSVSNEPSSSGTSSQSRPRVSSKSKSRPKSSHSQVKINPVPPKPPTQKPLEDEQTTQRILYILAEYKEQVENSPDKDKPAPRRRSNPPSNPGSSKRKKSSSGSRRPGARDTSPVQGDDACRTMGSEDSSCGTSQGDCTETCMEMHSPQDSPRKVARKLTFEQETAINQPRPQPQRNVIVADGQTITVARGAGGKPATAVLMPANYILPVSMVKGGQQIAIVTNRGPKLLTVGGGEGGATNALLLQRLIGPAGLKPVIARPGVRHVRLPTAALHNLQTFNLATATTVQPPDSTNTASPAPAPTPPELIDTRAETSPWTERESEPVRQERASTPEGSEPWNMPTSSDAQEYSYEETVRAENMDRTVLDPIPDRYSPDMEAQRIFDKMFDVESKKCFIVDSHDEPHCGYGVEASEEDKGYQVVQKKEGPSQRAHRVTHISAAALRHKYAILEHELRLQKSLSEECEDLGVDSPSASELFPEAELLFAASPAQDPPEPSHHNHHTPQPTLLNQTTVQADIDDQIATDQLLPRENPQERRQLDVNLGLEDVGIVTVSEDGMQATIALDQEEFARSHPNTTFHSEPSDTEVHQPFTITGIKGSRQISTIFHANRVPATVLMTAPQATTVISQTAEPPQGSIKYSDIDHMIRTLPGAHTNNVNLNSVLVKDDGLTRFENILTDSRELHLSNTASAIVHPTGNATQVIRRVCYDDGKRERDARFLMDEPDTLIAGDDAKMIAEDSSRDATMESMAEDVDDDNSSPERHAELFWESNSASERSESRRPLDYSSDSEKCCKSPSFDETNSTDSSGVGSHMRLDSVIKEARLERSGSAEGSSADDTHPPLRTYPPKRMYHNPETEMERSLSGKTRAGERSPDLVEGRRRTSVRGVVKRGCHCCNGSPTPAPPRPKKPRQRKPTLDFNTNN